MRVVTTGALVALGGAIIAGCGGTPEVPDAATPMVDAAMPPDAARAPDAAMRMDDAAMPMDDAAMDAAMPMDDAAMPMDGGPPPEPCATPGATESVPCGMCGTRTRFCTSARVWESGDCTGERGVCEAGTTMDVMCGPGGTVTSRCNDRCTWEAVGECSTPLWSCAMPLEAMATEGTTTILGDTSAGGPGPLDLGAVCGAVSADPTMRPPQLVARYVVPGTGMRTILLTTATPGTPADFDTLIQVRRGDCTMAPAVREGTCFDDGVPPSTPPAMPADFRTQGSFVATGGETLFFVVTGFGGMGVDHVYEGPFQLDVTVGDLTPPTLTAATLETVTGTMTGDTARLTVTGGDASMDASGAIVTLLGATGTALDRNGDMTVDAADDFRVPFGVPGLSGMATFTGVSTDDFFLFGEINRLGAARARVRLYDAVGAESAPLTIDITGVRQVGYGEACDMTRVCGPGLACNMGTCGATPEHVAACAAATTITLAGSPATGSAMGTLPTGETTILRPTGCLGRGAPVFYTVDVPAGSFDLIASTVNAGTATTLDTVVYALSTCTNPNGGPAGACVDDLMGERRATLTMQNVAAGRYTLAVTAFGALATSEPFTLDVRLRPVLATGATCDPAGAMNRCAAGACPAGGVCP